MPERNSITRSTEQNQPNMLLRQARVQRSWTQKQVAEKIGLAQALNVNRWEQGRAMPSPYFRQRLCDLFGKSAQELGLLSPAPPLSSGQDRQPLFLQAHWGDAPAIRHVYGREHEITILQQWIKEEQSAIVAVLGMGGVGKTLLATVVAQKVQHHFEVLIWYSLINAPLPAMLVQKWLQFLAPELQVDAFSPLEDQITLLMSYLQNRRVLLILDNVESILQPGIHLGPYRTNYEGYGFLFQRIGEMSHQSCLLLTSREFPRELALLDGESTSVRWYQLDGLALQESRKLLSEKRVQGTIEVQQELVSFYAGNPLALKLVAQFIYEVYGGQITDFLKEHQGVFCDVSEVLEQQFTRLALSEQEMMYWLAIKRIPATFKELQDDIFPRKKLSELAETARSLRRRSLIEQKTSHFLLQNVVMEFITEKLVTLASAELATGTPYVLRYHALLQAQAQDYVRDAQIRLIISPLKEKLVTSYGREAPIQWLLNRVAELRQAQQEVADYLAGNILNLLVQFDHDLSGTDFSRLWIVQAYLHSVKLHNVMMASSHLSKVVFAETLGPLRSLAWSQEKDFLLTGATTGEFHVWDVREGKLLLAHRGHRNAIFSIAFHPDGHMFATAGSDGSIGWWEFPTGRCLAVSQEHTGAVSSLAFSPDGTYLVSLSYDQSLCLWHTQVQQLSKRLWGHTSWGQGVTFSPDSTLVASCALDNTVRIWSVESGDCLAVIAAHQGGCRSVAFHPQGILVASGGGDGNVRLWERETWACLATFEGHQESVWSVAFHPDGHLLASGGEDRTVRIWDLYTGQICHLLQGHIFAVRTISFNTYGTLLASGGDDKMVRIWDIPDAQCRRVLQGSQQSVHAIALSPDNRLLATGNEDSTVQLWDMQTHQWLLPLQGHTYRVGAVRFSPDGTLLASASEDGTVRLWNRAKRQCLHVFQGSCGMIGSLVFHPDGRYLACSDGKRVVHLWNIQTFEGRHFSSDGGNVAFHPHGHLLVMGAVVWDLQADTGIRTFKRYTGDLGEIAFSPDGSLCAFCRGENIQLFSTASWDVDQTFSGHTNRVWSVAFHPAGKLLASSSEDQTIRLWDISNGQCLHILSGHLGSVRSVTFGSDGDTLVSGCVDGTIRFWNVTTGQLHVTVKSNRLYEGLNIHDVRGLTPAQQTTLIALGAITDLPE